MRRTNADSQLRKDRATSLAPLQHRHFATIATIINRLEPAFYDPRSLADHFADLLAKTNPRFDRERFLRACLDVVTKG